jgi:hypothetical protein
MESMASDPLNGSRYPGPLRKTFDIEGAAIAVSGFAVGRFIYTSGARLNCPDRVKVYAGRGRKTVQNETSGQHDGASRRCHPVAMRLAGKNTPAVTSSGCADSQNRFRN